MLHLHKLLSLSALALALASPLSLAEQKSVAVTALVEHPALDAARDGIKDALAEGGYRAGENLKWQYQSAQGNNATASQIARKFIGDEPDVLVGISTPSAQALVAATKRLPVVFTAVTDPVAAQLTSSWEASGSNVTGVSDQLALDEQVKLIKRLLPDATRVGMVYNSSEANSLAVVKQLKAMLPAHGLTLVESAVGRSVDVGPAARSLAGKVDLIYSNTDNLVISAYESLVKVGNEARIPLIASDPDSAERGATAALGVDYYSLGKQTGAQVLRILNGEQPGNIAPETGRELRLVLNAKAAAAQGVTLSDEVKASADQLIE